MRKGGSARKSGAITLVSSLHEIHILVLMSSSQPLSNTAVLSLANVDTDVIGSPTETPTPPHKINTRGQEEFLSSLLLMNSDSHMRGTMTKAVTMLPRREIITLYSVRSVY